jgi:hypothetical protein
MIEDPNKELCAILNEAGLTPKIGLEAQGHIPKVEQMRAKGKSWEEIGKAIGWHGPSVKEWYEHHRIFTQVRWAFIQDLVRFRGFGPTTCPVCNQEWVTVDPGGECPAHKVYRASKGL